MSWLLVGCPSGCCYVESPNRAVKDGLLNSTPTYNKGRGIRVCAYVYTYVELNALEKDWRDTGCRCSRPTDKNNKDNDINNMITNIDDDNKRNKNKNKNYKKKRTLAFSFQGCQCWAAWTSVAMQVKVTNTGGTQDAGV